SGDHPVPLALLDADQGGRVTLDEEGEPGQGEPLDELAPACKQVGEPDADVDTDQYHRHERPALTDLAAERRTGLPHPSGSPRDALRALKAHRYGRHAVWADRPL